MRELLSEYFELLLEATCMLIFITIVFKIMEML